LRRPPARRDLYADRAGWTDDVNPFDEAGGFNQRAEWMTLFGDTRAVWAAAWIDAREALQSAYARVRRVRDPARRAALVAELADIPVEMADVASYRSARKELESSKPAGVEEWKARQRMAWAQRFRDHYEHVGAKAH
jgi:hypothetical protein